MTGQLAHSSGVVVVAPWIRWWLGLSAVLVVYDAGYSLLRPWTFPGAPLATLWAPYNNLYQHVDLVYSTKRWLEGDRFCEAQSVCNLVEVALQLLALRLLASQKHAQAGALVALTTQGFTWWKTVLYWLMDILSGFAATGHNDLFTLTAVYVIPNGTWLVLPLLVVINLAGQVLAALNSKQGTKAA